MANSPHFDLTARSETLLDWPAVLASLAAQAVTPTGKEACARLETASDPSTIAGWYAEVREWLAVYDRRGDLPLAAGADPRPALGAAIEGGMLDAAQCREIALMLDQARDIRRALAESGVACPHLAGYAQRLDDVPELRRAIAEAIDPEGNLRESATPELRRLRHEEDRLRRSIGETVDGLLRAPRYEPWLQDAFVTQREDRYVLPIKIEHRTKVGGIVHDLSASGATVFIEPEELVEANNDLKWAELAVSEEIERIFRRLTDLAARHRAALAGNLAVVTQLDVIQAKGRLGLAYRGTIPRLATDDAIAWRGLRHPLLVLRGAAAVPNDVALAPGTRALVISGPNMGGKTVLLKAMGLAALMTRAGLPLACDEDSVAPVFPAVVMEAGDDQDLARDLSTFAGHIRIVAAMLATTPPGALVLMDELATATDPDEGAALAQAMMEAFTQRGVLAIVTTHYAALKAWAADGAGRVSGAMGYDVDALAPTYGLSLGRPGRSLGLEVAGRLGLPGSLLTRARELVIPQAAALERAIGALETERQAAVQTQARLAALETAAREAALRQDAAAAALEEEHRKIAAARKAKIAEEVARAKQEIDRILEGARKEREPARLRVLRQRIESVEAAEIRAEPAPITEGRRDFAAGAPVHVTSLHADGTLLDPTHGRRRVRVRIGEHDVVVAPSVLAPAEGPAVPQTSRTPGGPHPPPEPPAETIDLLGLRVEEALVRIDRRLDEAMAGGLTRLRLLHGHGTGRLKTAIRAHLAASPYVASHRAGDAAEGGDAVTIVTLAI